MQHSLNLSKRLTQDRGATRYAPVLTPKQGRSCCGFCQNRTQYDILRLSGTRHLHPVRPKCSVTMTFRLMNTITTGIAYLHTGSCHSDILSGVLRTLPPKTKRRVFSRGRIINSETIIRSIPNLCRTESPTVQHRRYV